MNIHAKGIAPDEHDAIDFLCTNVEKTTLDDIPASARVRIADHLMDIVEVGIAASEEPTAR
ncbi:hypothetical protein ACUSIJ_14135 [Pseudochelatococcus sp. B33]